jgi:serine/threonine protein kinase/formylglycine-generating enzyme required for sulfatase activity
MPFCKKCGKKLDDDAAFCPGCGTPVAKAESIKQTTESSTESTIRKDDVHPSDAGHSSEGADDFKTRIRGASSYGVLNLEDLPAGHVIDDRYEIKEKVGQGGFGAVYRVFDRTMEIDKALKVIPQAVVSDAEALYDLQQEAKTMIALNHPNIVRVFDFHNTGSIKYIDMEYVPGKTLTQLKLECPNKQMPEAQVKEYAIKIAQGMAYAHQNNVLHKDIKPQNIKVTPEGAIKIMDFGIAEKVRTSMSRIQNSSSSGTLVYMSPEQIKGKDVGKESDIYSFGAMLYELLSGHPPFYKGDVSYQILNEEPEPLSNVSSQLNDAILHCLEKEYANRCKNFDEVIQQLGGKLQVYKQDIMNSKKQTVTGSSSKVKALAPLVIQTEPPDAEVTIDGKKISKLTPIDVEYPCGSYKIDIFKEGYDTIKDRIQVREGVPNKFYLVLESLMGAITVETEPSGMTIWMNGEDTGEKTPFTFENIIPGEYRIKLKGDIYYYPETTIKLKSKESKTFKPNLFEVSFLTIKTTYKSTFKIDGQTVNTNEQISLEEGEYEIISSLDFLEPQKITLHNGEERVYNFDEQVKRRTINIHGDETPTEADFFYTDGNPRDIIDLHMNEENRILPGKGTLRLSNKHIQKEIEIDQELGDVAIDFATCTQEAVKKRKRLVKVVISSFSVIILILIISQLIMTINEPKNWEAASKENTLESYYTYVNKYPKGKFSDEAKKQLCDLSMKNMVFVQGGTFQMGSDAGDNDERPVHTVTIDDFFIGKYPVTQEEWEAVMGNNPSYSKGDNLPVEVVSWYAAVEFCNKKSEKEGLQKSYTINKRRRDSNNKNTFDDVKWTVTCNLNANGYRLPTEAEWEYAAQGGNKSRNYKYSGSNTIDDVAWYSSNSGSKPHPVGYKKSNELGIFDMSGNVWEWCWDWFGSYSSSSQTNPKGASTGYRRVQRGGCWDYGTDFSRVANRYNCNPDSGDYSIGFRLARSSK